MKKEEQYYGVYRANFRAQGVEVAWHKKNKIFCQFFSTCEKINQFLEFCKDQGIKI